MRLSLTRRLAAGVLLACAGTAFAQSAPWPAKPIRLLVAAPAGSAPDLIARIIGDKLSRQLGQPILVDNKPGANGIIAMHALRDAPADGYTLALPQAAAVVVTPFTYKNANYDSTRDFETIAVVGKTPMMFVAHNAHPAKTLADAIAMARAKPDTVSVGNPTRTSIPHLASELVAQKANAQFQQVAFANTGQGIQAVVAGDIAMYVDGVGPLLPLTKGGKMRALAVASETELPGLEGIPLANKTVPGLSVYGWFVMQAPKGTPAAILARLNTEVNKAMQEPDVVAKFREFGTYPTPGDMKAAKSFLAEENARFGGVIKTLNLKPE
ncbi:Bug family tripartite tricarboxylate transporter substrate binding protein [Ottowia sp. VDI28]|uniref:Bug family tripartite tricarboxylate transporter substrate binding protein n=1 Tax=Ottowia sp. VDI28 TaxID=3133968 RepID=UPI003C2AE826